MSRSITIIALAALVSVPAAARPSSGGAGGTRAGSGSGAGRGGLVRPGGGDRGTPRPRNDGRSKTGPTRPDGTGREGRGPRVTHHRDRNGDGRPDRHFRRHGGTWWPFFVGYGFGPFGFRNSFYDPFYSPFQAVGSQEQLEDLGRNITIRVKPESAQVRVNGLLYSSKGRTAFDLPSGKWQVEISASGYRTEVIDLNVEQGVRYNLERTLQKDRTSDPRGRPLKEEEIPSSQKRP